MSDVARSADSIAVMPYCFVVERGPEGPYSALSAMSRIATLAAVEVCLNSPGAQLVLAGESHPDVPLPGTSELMTNLAAERGLPAGRVTQLDGPDRPANNTAQQVSLFAKNLSGKVTVLGWDYHLPRVKVEAVNENWR